MELSNCVITSIIMDICLSVNLVSVGDRVGLIGETALGYDDGDEDSCEDKNKDGAKDGARDRAKDGAKDRPKDGIIVEDDEGRIEGYKDNEGDDVGDIDGKALG